MILQAASTSTASGEEGGESEDDSQAGEVTVKSFGQSVLVKRFAHIYRIRRKFSEPFFVANQDKTQYNKTISNPMFAGCKLLFKL